MRIGINGLGRIGRGLLKAIFDDTRFTLAAVNDVAEPGVIAHLLNHDTYYGRWRHRADSPEPSLLLLDDRSVSYSRCATPAEIPWGDAEVDWVVEATGHFKDRTCLAGHCLPVLLTAVSEETDRQIVFGVNHRDIKPADSILSATSCTTHCVVPPLFVLEKHFGVEAAFFNTVHCYNVSQTLVDAPQADLRRARAGALNMIPTTTSASRALEAVMPSLRGKTRGMAVRVPAPAASLTEIVFRASKKTSREAVLDCLRRAAGASLKGILETTREELVSQDFVGNTASSVIDEGLVEVQGDLVRLIAWYDNECGYVHRLVDLLAFLREERG